MSIKPWTIHNMTVAQWAESYTGPPFHAMLCDPPYELGFMGRDWDRSGVAFDPRTWEALARHLLPGAFVMAFAASRGWHRMAVAMEDAGLVIHPTIFGWSYGSGFPKATRIDTQVDAAAGAEREVKGVSSSARPNHQRGNAGFNRLLDNDNEASTAMLTAPATPLAQAWEGHRYGLQALKPALEPVIVAQVPYGKGKPVEVITSRGAGALNIDAGRIGTEVITTQGGEKFPNLYEASFKALETQHTGRWPANFTLTHAPECNGHCVEGCPVRLLDEQSGELGVSSGGASRFFYNATWSHEVLEQIEGAPVVGYYAKASRKERNAGAEELPAQEWIDGAAVANRDIRPNRANPNPHPSVKPIALTKWLAGLLLPPAQYGPRRLLNPFGGSGSEAIGGILAGWEEVHLIEMDTDEGYVDIEDARLTWWHNMSQAHPGLDVEALLKQHRPPVESAPAQEPEPQESQETQEPTPEPEPQPDPLAVGLFAL